MRFIPRHYPSPFSLQFLHSFYPPPFILLFLGSLTHTGLSSLCLILLITYRLYFLFFFFFILYVHASDILILHNIFHSIRLFRYINICLFVNIMLKRFFVSNFLPSRSSLSSHYSCRRGYPLFTAALQSPLSSFHTFLPSLRNYLRAS